MNKTQKRRKKVWNDEMGSFYLNSWFKGRFRNKLNSLPKIKPFQIMEDKNGFFIIGKVGEGKTIYAAQTMLEIAKQEYILNGKFSSEYIHRNITNENKTQQQKQTGIFLTLAEIIQEVKNTYNKNSEFTENEIIKKYQNMELLAIDDFFAIRPTEDVWRILFLIIDYRYNNYKFTIITADKGLEEGAEFLNDHRITRRINEMCATIKMHKFTPTLLSVNKG